MKDLKKRIGDIAFFVTQNKGTEKPFSGEYNLHFPKGGYYSCIVCDEPLFKSEQKFETHCGWPAFNSSIAGGVIGKKFNFRKG